MYAFADKLLEVSERHADKIAEQWCKAVKTNPHTPWFQSAKHADCNSFAVDFYKNFRNVYFDEKPYKKLEKYFANYAEESFHKGIPMEEAIYALIMMRRHLWLYADFQALFVTATGSPPRRGDPQPNDPGLRPGGLHHHQALQGTGEGQEVADIEQERIESPAGTCLRGFFSLYDDFFLSA